MRKQKGFFQEYQAAVGRKKAAQVAYYKAKDEFDRYCDQARVVIKKNEGKITVADVEGKLAAQVKYAALKADMRMAEADYEEARDMIFAFTHAKELILDMSQNIRSKLWQEEDR